MSEPPPEPSREVPYASPTTGRNGDGFGSLVPLLSGFGLLGLGLMTLVFGQPEGGTDVAQVIGLLVAAVGVGLVAVGVIVIFRALRRYDW